MNRQQILYQTANFMGEAQNIFSMVSCFYWSKGIMALIFSWTAFAKHSCWSASQWTPSNSLEVTTWPASMKWVFNNWVMSLIWAGSSFDFGAAWSPYIPAKRESLPIGGGAMIRMSGGLPCRPEPLILTTPIRDLSPPGDHGPHRRWHQNQESALWAAWKKKQ